MKNPRDRGDSAELIGAAEAYADRFAKRDAPYGGCSIWWQLYDTFKEGAKWQQKVKVRKKHRRKP